MSVRFITRLIDRNEDSTEDWFKKSFKNILAQDYIIRMSCMIPIEKKHAYLWQCNQGKTTKCSNSECKCSIYNHDNDALWRCMIAMMVQHEDGVFHAQMKLRIWHDAFAMMLVQWRIHHDAKMMMLLMYACMRCISMMRTHMSWGCTWLAPRNHSLVTNTWLVLYPWARIKS